MDKKEALLDILEDLTGSDEARENMDVSLFDEGLLDSLGTVQLLIEIEGTMGISVPVSEFDRTEWATPNLILQQLENM
ncbi:D-alanine--poly(phosphoribitol) ligase subunit 2 [Carnobacterium maltaromaticum]|uniref:D-alanine--poly(phosphoribitol) ligase subunit DltC n=1 Tax=Carnobacterium maltaromaticum TaxID=2751 RepID=UPI000C756660|nr:D-alanine--poly(phosphoribitol) ligase subunit DltC [Carnobacterium maltaromaticum]PLS34835.1 D-alanine--poly(phosphoribitol) ligase subunit 2 [Carnobacterium maltaromaticum]PLS36654.1 D-alanine--poly(phosphoribitol) ligase subunit 2 [Carnobacterium maltaromaticum]PLS37469.1 D-alanine--poly(phosphoribitol) ligase subunit 2 [Carnobacterium maltaromaticum]PLS43685.1 D-alanine--poly(phosphoribitol) ligase subunit 2 [Carnobacterium maltaromaticum]PLS44029.1 D-alanine--poly(phosphoribitol) ligas